MKYETSVLLTEFNMKIKINRMYSKYMQNKMFAATFKTGILLWPAFNIN